VPDAARVGVSRWEDVPGESIERYWQRLREAGLEPIDLRETGQALDGCAGLVLTGGVDVAPALYGEAPHEKVRRTDPARDAFELALLKEALAADLPVLAICRGHQLLNVALGGSLLQHIESGDHRADYRSEGFPSRRHKVRLTEGRRLSAWLEANTIEVNSRHHQAVTPSGLATALEALAVSEDGLVEAVASRGHAWLVGVQWHPERDEPEIPGFREASARLWRRFAAAVREAASA
jgi:gamma-glutamyl-gamma-aminobutyrate hydrolase PuuD